MSAFDKVSVLETTRLVVVTVPVKVGLLLRTTAPVPVTLSNLSVVMLASNAPTLDHVPLTNTSLLREPLFSDNLMFPK